MFSSIYITAEFIQTLTHKILWLFQVFSRAKSTFPSQQFPLWLIKNMRDKGLSLNRKYSTMNLISHTKVKSYKALLEIPWLFHEFWHKMKIHNSSQPGVSWLKFYDFSSFLWSVWTLYLVTALHCIAYCTQITQTHPPLDPCPHSCFGTKWKFQDCSRPGIS